MRPLMSVPQYQANVFERSVARYRDTASIVNPIRESKTGPTPHEFSWVEQSDDVDSDSSMATVRFNRAQSALARRGGLMHPF